MQPRTARVEMTHLPGSWWSGREGAVVWWEERGGTHAGMAGRAEAVAVGGGWPRGASPYLARSGKRRDTRPLIYPRTG